MKEKSSGEVWFTSDTHFNHANIIRFCNRPFDSVGEMNEALITNWNGHISPNDTVYHLGDFSMGNASKILSRLNGNVCLIRGNHDKHRDIKDAAFGWIKDVYFLKTGKRASSWIWLSHYAHRRWPNAHHGSIHLYGHSHGELPGMGRSMDIGVDAFDYKPVHLDYVMKILNEKESAGHHKR